MKKIQMFLTIALLGALIGQYIFTKDQAKESLSASILKATQDSNATVTKLFINSLYPEIEDVLQLNNASAASALLSKAEFELVDAVIRKFVLGTDVLKVKVYSVTGLTKYSSDASQVGEDKSANTGFMAALRGSAGSQITHRDAFSAMEGEVFNRDLVASYIPIRGSDSSVIGVAELYTDRTPAIQQSERRFEDLQFVLIISMTIVLLFAFGVVGLSFAISKQR